jgi:hypothetical protein
MGSRQVFVNELVTVDDLAKRWKMSVGQVSNIVCGRDGRKRTHFPQPVCGKGTRAVWLWPDAQEWFEKNAPKSKLEERRASRKGKKTAYVNQHPLTA